MKKLLKKLLCLVTAQVMTLSFIPVVASENVELDETVIDSNEIIIVDKYSDVLNHPYALDMDGNLLLDSNDFEVVGVEVVYDGAWYGMRTANVPRIINVTVVCKGTGVFGQAMYNCKLNVALEFKYNTDTMKITSVGKPDVYSYTAPGTPQAAKNPRATASITNSGKSVTIYGYIDYSAAGQSQTFKGSTTYYL